MVLITTTALFNLLPGVNKNFVINHPQLWICLSYCSFLIRQLFVQKNLKRDSSLILNVLELEPWLVPQNHRNHGGFVLLVIYISIC